MSQSRIIPTIPAKIGEGLLSEQLEDGTTQLWWIDIHQPHIHTYHPLSDHYQFFRVSDINTGFTSIHPTDQPNIYLLSSWYNLHTWDATTNQLTNTYQVEPKLPSNIRFNDAKLDPKGNLVIGTMDIKDRPNRGTLYRLDFLNQTNKIAQLTSLLTNISLSNGLDWSTPNNSYYVDTPTRKIQCYSYSDMRYRFDIDLSDYDGVPDGITISADGFLWVAMWEGQSILKIDLNTIPFLVDGPPPKIERIFLENIQSPTSIAITHDALWLTSAQTPTNSEGHLFKVQSGINNPKKRAKFSVTKIDTI